VVSVEGGAVVSVRTAAFGRRRGGVGRELSRKRPSGRGRTLVIRARNYCGGLTGLSRERALMGESPTQVDLGVEPPDLYALLLTLMIRDLKSTGFGPTI
jgi:hypothetical protein